MARWFGKIGYSIQHETPHGVWVEDFIIKDHYGDILENNRRLQNSESTNDNVLITNRISILSDPFANVNFHNMRWIEYLGIKWKIETASVSYHRIELSLGGEYHT